MGTTRESCCFGLDRGSCSLQRAFLGFFPPQTMKSSDFFFLNLFNSKELLYATGNYKEREVARSTLCNPVDCRPPGSSVHGVFRPEYYSGLPFPSLRDLPKPGIEPGSPAMRAEALPSEPPGNLTGNYSHSLIITYSGKQSEKEQHVYALSPLHISRFCSRSASVSPVYPVSPTKLALVPN